MSIVSAEKLAALKADLTGIAVEDNDKIVQQKSRDFYWYSPVLKSRLDHVTGDLVVSPKTEAELIQVLKACYKHGVPVTPRGTGTGNYGQAMPLSGGVVLSLADMNAIKAIYPGRVICEPGCIISDIDKATKAHSGQELRMHPSTYHTASIGGFIAGGSGGVGSTRWGGLRDFGNVIRLRVVTMEAEPRVLELTGQDLHKAIHAYGTNGIITEVEMPLTTSYEWLDVIIAFETLRAATIYANALGRSDGILLKLNTVVAAPAPFDYFKRHQKFVTAHDHIVAIMVARHNHDAFLAFNERHGGRLIYDALTASEEDSKGLPPAYELGWNHTTLRALRIDPKVTYLQVLYPFPGHVDLVCRMAELFPDDLITHLEFVRFDGDITCFGLPLIKFTTEERLEEIIDIHNREGAPIFNPHRYTLEEGGMKQTDEIQLAFKKEADPKGLLNPGKMIAWDDPDYDYKGGVWLFRGLQQAS
jgi:FAD/FMN-containing dehydrogenase